MVRRHIILPVFVPHLGCPHTCAFCNQWNITGQTEVPTPQKLSYMIKEYSFLIKDKSDAKIEIAFYGGSFTGIDESIQENLLSTANDFIKKGIIHGIRISTRPDYIDEKIIERLIKYNVNTVELGVQSMDQGVLDQACRGHTSEDVIKAVDLLKKHKINIGIQIMPGLPGDSKISSIQTAFQVVKLKPNFVRIYPTLVLKNTDLEKWFNQGIYQTWSLEYTIDVCKDIYIIFIKENIPVIRIGLQATENLTYDRDLVAGPYHPSIGEIIKSAVFLEQMKMLFKKNSKKINPNHIILMCNYKDTSKVMGQNKYNIKYFFEKENFKILVKQSHEIEKSNIALVNENLEIIDLLTREDFIKNYRII